VIARATTQDNVSQATMVRLVIGCVAMFFVVVGVATAETPLERGSYLVNAVMACDGCHTPRGPSGFVMEKRL
jgi:hypothetical protein